MAPRLELDHLAVTAPSLDAGLAHVQRALGIALPAGGAHAQMATHNHLMRLGEDAFLEVIAPDPDAPPPSRPRWFALDRLRGHSARLATWVVRTPDLAASLAAMAPSVGQATPITRGDLSWLISVPDDGAMPFEGAHPMLIEWPKGRLPGTTMAERGCRLVSLCVRHPNAAEIAQRLAPVFEDGRVRFETANTCEIVAEIETPSGLHRLS